ncbi:siderophore-interacting protein [Parendozoicomonas haliclonae]|uniref:Vibriobactin utilization protein ViuB n=1 Tax=Parendozoicomonas haliclonae TaxID=1960125 RepID=A0A1X7ARG6_9GAMM|nr:siderophore-interacting protein [Parendozoicomonas haliclonae]SMA50680.1 Vibriobactin utilization protein ViuB [Parendozoicomonas haliclonae]
MAKKSFLKLTVESTTLLTPNMQRIVLSGTSLAEFPQPCESGYIKLLFLPDGRPVADEASLAALNGQRPVMRTYTIRTFDANKLTITVDFALHGKDGHSGPASRWASSCEAGDTICIAGPGPVKLIHPEAEWFFLAGDITALPAISCNLEQLPQDAKGVAIIEVPDLADQQNLQAPAGIDIIWVTSQQALLDAALAQSWPEADVAAWCACEFSAMRQIRQFLKTDKQLPREKLYISSYWKQGSSEEEHKNVKRLDAETEEA